MINNKNVYELTQERLAMIFRDFDNVCVSFSGGKDSAALAVYMAAKHPELDIDYFYTDTGEELPEVGGEVGFAAFHLGADGAEVHEPVLEQGAGHGLQGLVAAAVEFDLVVQRAEDVGDGALFRKRG